VLGGAEDELIKLALQHFRLNRASPKAEGSSDLGPIRKATSGAFHCADRMLLLQRTIGNQAVQRMLQTHPGELGASRIPVGPPAVGPAQTKRAIDEPGHEFEREAYRVAEDVMRMPEPGLQRPSKEPAPGPEHLQIKPVGPGDLGQTAIPPSVDDALSSHGQSLDPATRAFMEPRFGRDFSQVRVHSGAAAEQSAQDVNAKAYTAGQSVVFGEGRFAPGTHEGRRLIAHELAHVAQQEADGPRLQRDPDGDEDLNPKYLRGMDARIRQQIERRLKLASDAGDEIETGPLSTMLKKYPPSPLREDAEIEIPAIDWNRPVTMDEPEHPKFRLHSRLPGGYELLDVHGARGEKVLIARGDTAYVIPDSLFSEIFQGYQELQEPIIYRHEHPEMVLAADLLGLGIGIGLAMMAPEAAGAEMCFMEAPGEFGGTIASEEALAMEGEAPGKFSPGEVSTGFEEEATQVDMEPFGATQAPGRPIFSFASEEAWFYDGRVVRVVNTPAGPRAFYQRTGGGGDFLMGAQPGDWAPFDGFQADPGGAIFVKPAGTFEPSTPLTLYRWGTAENQAISEWIQAQPEAAPVDVGESWGEIQGRLQDLGVPVRYPLD
jgi:hypothetical protein